MDLRTEWRKLAWLLAGFLACFWLPVGHARFDTAVLESLRLVRWYADGAEVDQKMLALSTYMGHAEIFYTYWYLTGVPELMAITAGRFEQFADLAGDDDA